MNVRNYTATLSILNTHGRPYRVAITLHHNGKFDTMGRINIARIHGRKASGKRA